LFTLLLGLVPFTAVTFEQSSLQDFHSRRSVTLIFDPVTLKTFKTMSYPLTRIFGATFHWNPSTKYCGRYRVTRNKS